MSFDEVPKSHHQYDPEVTPNNNDDTINTIIVLN